MLATGRNLPRCKRVLPPIPAGTWAKTRDGGTRIVEDRTMPIMWLSLISIATAASIGLTVAAIVVRTANQNESLNN
jgi:hypothetical protein